MEKMQVHTSLVVGQAFFAGFEILGHIALDAGLGVAAFTFYLNVIAMLLLGSYSIVMERSTWVHISFGRACYIFFLGFLGVTMNQVCYLYGLSLTSVLFASMIRNLIPTFTFFLALIFKLEKVNLRCINGRAKVSGAVLALTGSLLLSLYRGPTIIASKFGPSHPREQHSSISNFNTRLHILSPTSFGTISVVVSSASFAMFLILQVPVLDSYSAPISFASLCCLSSVIQLPLMGAIFRTNWNTWMFWNMKRKEALCVIYAGIIGSGTVSGIQSWAMQKHSGGPVVVAAYQPLETLMTASLSFFLLRESLHLGTLLGGIAVVLGLYLLVWGQIQELQNTASASEVPAHQV